MDSLFLGKARSIQVIRKRIVTPKHAGSIRGSVSDIRVFDQGKLVDYHAGGDNTISSGASWNLLQSAFEPYTGSVNANNQYYTDANGNVFPSPYTLNGWGTCNSNWTAPNATTISPGNTLFGQVVGLKGGSGGLASHVTSLSGLNAAWWLGIDSNANATDWGTPYTTGQSFNRIQSGANPNSIADYTSNNYTVSASYSRAKDQNTNGGVPYVSWNITVTSSSAAQAYTIDSIGWIPRPACRITSNGSQSNTVAYCGYFPPSTAQPSSLSVVPTQAANTATPATFNSYISALFVLPYLVTVNPGGAIQFTYTFQGS